MSLENETFPTIAESKEVIKERLTLFSEGCFGIFKNKKLIGYVSCEIWNEYHKIKSNENPNKTLTLKVKFYILQV